MIQIPAHARKWYTNGDPTSKAHASPKPGSTTMAPAPDPPTGTVAPLATPGARGRSSHQSLLLLHHSLVQYKLPGTGELVPLLQIAPSKTDAERLLLVSPELGEVLAAIICRVRASDGAIPLVAAYDDRERQWLPPAPVLFQRRMCQVLAPAACPRPAAPPRGDPRQPARPHRRGRTRRLARRSGRASGQPRGRR
jgi:hypothetical protein